MENGDIQEKEGRGYNHISHTGAFYDIIYFLENQYQCQCDLKAYNGVHSLSCNWQSNNKVICALKQEYEV